MTDEQKALEWVDDVIADRVWFDSREPEKTIKFLKVLRSALEPKMVTREWVQTLVNICADIREPAEEIIVRLNELGIEVVE
uniref:Uncharacterized protein n=1 Tax=viral metagenome TaxID=1070528 RepID=A0A6H1ZHK1_9ZZZZ